MKPFAEKKDVIDSAKLESLIPRGLSRVTSMVRLSDLGVL